MRFQFGVFAYWPPRFTLPLTAGLTRADYIDLFLIHDPMSGTERRIATYRALLEARALGKVRSVGVSN